MAPKSRTTVSLERQDYDLLDEVRKANGWAVGDAISRAIHALWVLDEHLKAMEQHQGGDVGRLIGRLRRDLDPGFLIRFKPMSKITTADGSVGVRIDDLMFFEDAGRLLARRDVDGRTEVYEAQGGKLALRYSGVPSEDFAMK